MLLVVMFYIALPSLFLHELYCDVCPFLLILLCYPCGSLIIDTDDDAKDVETLISQQTYYVLAAGPYTTEI